MRVGAIAAAKLGIGVAGAGTTTSGGTAVRVGAITGARLGFGVARAGTTVDVVESRGVGIVMAVGGGGGVLAMSTTPGAPASASHAKRCELRRVAKPSGPTSQVW